MSDEEIKLSQEEFKQLMEFGSVMSRVVKSDRREIDVKSMIHPGTIIWRDPLTGEDRYAKPGDRMYSTALMYAEYHIDKHGNRKPYGLFEEKIN